MARVHHVAVFYDPELVTPDVIFSRGPGKERFYRPRWESLTRITRLLSNKGIVELCPVGWIWRHAAREQGGEEEERDGPKR